MGPAQNSGIERNVLRRTAALIILLLQLIMGREKANELVREMVRKLFLAVDRRK